MSRITLTLDSETYPVEIAGEQVIVGKNLFLCLIEQRGRSYHVIVRGKRYRLEIKETGVGKYEITLDGEKHVVFWEERRGRFPFAHRPAVKKEKREIEISSPMPGRIVRINARKSDRIRNGDVILTLEAMKMENAIATNISGTVKEIMVKEGDTVAGGQVLAIIKEES